MKWRWAKQCSAFTKVELIFLVGVVGLIVLFSLPTHNRDRVPASRIRCVNNLKIIGLGFRVFATDHGDRFPFQMTNMTASLTNAGDASKHFLALPNAIINSPMILHCPADKERKPAESLTNLSDKNLSYFVNLSASESFPERLLAGDRNLEADGVPLGPGRVVLTLTNYSWTKALHDGHGDVAMGDGSVRQLSTARLRETFRQRIETNILLFP